MGMAEDGVHEKRDQGDDHSSTGPSPKDQLDKANIEGQEYSSLGRIFHKNEESAMP